MSRRKSLLTSDCKYSELSSEIIKIEYPEDYYQKLVKEKQDWEDFINKYTNEKLETIKGKTDLILSAKKGFGISETELDFACYESYARMLNEIILKQEIRMELQEEQRIHLKRVEKRMKNYMRSFVS